MQDPLRRTEIGFDTSDHILDIVISPDKRRWAWKDEDQLEEAMRLGVFSRERADQVKLEGQRVIDGAVRGLRGVR